MERLLILDGNSVLNRAFYGIRTLNAPDLTPTNGVYGFLNILLKNIHQVNYNYVCAAFDLKEKTFRKIKYAQYKSQRAPTPSDLIVQIPIVKEILAAMNIAVIEKSGYEADDIIGTVSYLCQQQGVFCDILTGDRDALSLISDFVNVKLSITKRGKATTQVYDLESINNEYGITPSQLVEVKGLAGDKSDNIPGITGIGPKTALELVRKYKKLEIIFENLNSNDMSPSIYKKLKEGRENAFLSRELATICRDVPLSISLENLRLKLFDREKLKVIFERLNFKSFHSKIVSNTL